MPSPDFISSGGGEEDFISSGGGEEDFISSGGEEDFHLFNDLWS